MQIRIRPLEEGDLAEADRILRLAFGTFLGLPDPFTIPEHYTVTVSPFAPCVLPTATRPGSPRLESGRLETKFAMQIEQPNGTVRARKLGVLVGGRASISMAACQLGSSLGWLHYVERVIS